MIYSSSISSIILQIFIIWLISTIFSKKKNKEIDENSGNIKTLFNDFIQKIYKKFEDKISEIQIVPDNELESIDLNLPLETEKSEPILHSDKSLNQDKSDLKVALRNALTTRKNKKKSTNKISKFGLESKSKLKNAIVINEILRKPVSLRK